MNQRLVRIAASIFLLALAACGGGSDSNTAPPSGNNSNTVTSFAYVAHLFGLTMSAFAINATTGALSEVPGSPYAVDRNALPGPVYIAVHPSGKFVYVVNSRSYTAEGPPQSGVVAAYAIDASTGSLSKVAGSPFTAGFGSCCLKIDPLGKFAYVANRVSHNVSAYAINAASGALSEIAGSPFTTGDAVPASMAIHPSGKFAYLANYGNPGTITTYAINATTGALTSVVLTAGAVSPGTITVDPSGKFAYLTEGGSVPTPPGGVLAYTINATTGELSEIAGSPFATGWFPNSIAVEPSGKFAYVAQSRNSEGSVAAFTINASTGALSLGDTYYAPPASGSVTIDDSGRFVYVISSNGVFAFTIDTATGRLINPREFATVESGNYITANRK